MTLAVQHRFSELRIHDLIAKVAHVRLKDTLRVLVALQVVSEEYDFPIDDILTMPCSADKPTSDQARDCERAYLWMYDNEHLNKLLCKIEQYA